MPDTRISDLTVLTAPAAGDLIPIVDISDTTMAASGTTKRVTQSVLSSSILASAQPLDATLTALAGLTIAADSLTFGTGADAFTQTTFAANTLPARASTGSLAAKPITDFGLSLIDDAAASNARTTLGLGTIATQAASSIAITGGTINGATVGATTPATGAFTSLSATGITTVASGTALLPSIVSTTGTADTGLWFPAADTLAASTAGSERIRISSTGLVGVGVTTPLAQLDIAAPIDGTSTIRLSQSNAPTSRYWDTKFVSAASQNGLQEYSFSSSISYTTLFRADTGAVGVGDFVAMAGGGVAASLEPFNLCFSTAPATNKGMSITDATNKRLVIGNTSSATVPSLSEHYCQIAALGNGVDLALASRGSTASKITLSTSSGASLSERVTITSAGSVGIGTTSPSYQLHVNTDSAGKPGAGGLWTVVSDERIKTDIVPANLSRCYDIVKQVGLKHFGFKPGVYSDEQINDKHSLGWIAQDVQKVFGKAVSIKPFTLQTDIPDGTEEYEEQAFTVETVNKVETSIQVINGKPVQASKTTQVEEKTLLFDEVVVVDVAGDIVMVDGAPLTHKVPRMVTKTRPKVRREVIEDCLDLNGGQMNAALYGAVQCLMAKVELQAVTIASLQASVAEQAHS